MSNRISKTYQIVTNLSCNLDCSYCYERKYPRNNNQEDIIDFLHACFDRDRHLKDIDVVIDVIGGEPMMQPKLLLAVFETAEMLAARDGRDYVFSVSTNGTLFNKKINRDIVERWKDRLSIGVSIDGLPENHDKYRIYTNTGAGSYHDAIKGYNYLKEVGIRDLGVKATFTLETLPFYAAGMKHLIDIAGGGTISGNVVFEDILPRNLAINIANQMIEVVEYWMEKGLHRNPRNQLTHVMPEILSVEEVWSKENKERLKRDYSYSHDPERLRPFCGAVTHMTCLGFDRLVYGCNRFMSTVTNRQATSKLVGREIVPIDGGKLQAEINQQYTEYPETCITCPMKPFCGSCAAAPYENKEGTFDDRAEYHSERRQCGWTMAKLLVSAHFKKLTGTYDSRELQDNTKCYCTKCARERGEL